MKNRKMSSSMKAMRMMSEGGGLKGYMNGGDVTDSLIKAQKGKETPKMVYKTSPYWADEYSVDTTGLSTNSSNYYPYTRSNGTRGVLTRAETQAIADKLKNKTSKKK